MKVQISGQYGDPKADIFWPMQKKLNDCFKEVMLEGYFDSLIELSIVFRVSGKVRDFKSQGPERMKHLKKDAGITIDLVFPESEWRGVEPQVVKNTVTKGVRECLQLMLDKAHKLKEVKDQAGFERDVDKAMAKFAED